jgi:hypothetical protein
MLPLVIAVAGCGSSEPDSSTKTAAPAKAATSASRAFVLNTYGKGGKALDQPTSLAFSVYGDVAAKDLKWSTWGKSAAVASGLIVFREGARGTRVSVRGTVTLNQPAQCGRTLYYTAAVITAPGAPFKPSPSTFLAPCAIKLN